MNLTELLDNAVCRWPKKPALIENNVIVSYSELIELAAKFTSLLRLFELSPGCRVGLLYPNSIDYVALIFSLWRENAVVVPIPMECTAEEISAIAATMRLEMILSQKAIGQGVALTPECFLTRLKPFSLPDNHNLNLAFSHRRQAARRRVDNWCIPSQASDVLNQRSRCINKNLVSANCHSAPPASRPPLRRIATE